MPGPFFLSCCCPSENSSPLCQGIYCVVPGPALLTAPEEIVFVFKSIEGEGTFEVGPEENNRSAGICFSQQRLRSMEQKSSALMKSPSEANL